MLFPGLADPDTVYLRILESYLPLVLASFIVTTIMAAAMSTANGNLHAMSALVTKDLYSRFLRPQAGHGELVWVGRTIIALASVVSLYLALLPNIPMIVQIGLISMAVSMQMFPSLIGPLFWKGATRAGVIAGIIAGMAVLLVTFKGWFGLGVNPLGIHYGFWGFMANIGAFYLVSKATQAPDEATLRRFHQGAHALAPAAGKTAATAASRARG